MAESARDPTDDLRLAQAVAAGEPEATRELCEIYLPRLQRYILRHSGLDEDDAAEQAQETLMAALRSAPRFRGDSTLYTWLCSIARRKVADYYRRRRRRPLSLDDLTASGLAIIDEQPLPEEVAVRREMARVVHRVVWGLPPRQREAVLEKYLAERSVADIAAGMGKTEKAVESLLSRGRTGLRKRFSELAREAGAGPAEPGPGPSRTANPAGAGEGPAGTGADPRQRSGER